MKASSELVHVGKFVMPQLDITEPSNIEIKVRADGQVVWVNVDGVCLLRACRIPTDGLVVEDARPNKI